MMGMLWDKSSTLPSILDTYVLQRQMHPAALIRFDNINNIIAVHQNKSSCETAIR